MSSSSHKNNVSNVPHYKSLLFEIYAPEIYEMFAYKHRETKEYVKK